MLTTATVYMGQILLEINFMERRLKAIHEAVENHLKEPQIHSIREQIFEFEDKVRKIA